MKIFILFSLYFLCSLCPGTNLKELTESQIARRNRFWLHRGAIRCSKLQDRNLGPSFTIQVIIADQPAITLNLTRVENSLTNSLTSVWIVEQEKEGGKIKDIQDHATMRAVGRFTLYRDYENEAAIVVFHDAHLIKGWVQNHRFENLVNNTNGSDDFNEIFVLKDEYLSSKFRELTGRIPYTTVVIQLAQEDISKGKRDAVMTTIANWNAVDMFYSKFDNAPVRINIIGILIPKDNQSNPWVTSNIFQNETGNYLTPQSLIDLDASFPERFPRTFIVSYVPENVDINATHPARGSDKKTRVAIIRSDESPSTIAYKFSLLPSRSTWDENQECYDEEMNIHPRRSPSWLKVAQNE